MDVALNRPFKCAIRKDYVAWRGEQIQAGQPWVPPDRPLVIKWVLDSWDGLGMSVVQAAMLKHAVEPALASGPLPLRPVASAETASAPPLAVDRHLECVSELALPQEELQDTSGVVEALDGNDSSSSDEEEEEEEEIGAPQGVALPEECCCKCQRPLRAVNRARCPTCHLSFHPACVAVSSSGKCQFCP